MARVPRGPWRDGAWHGAERTGPNAPSGGGRPAGIGEAEEAEEAGEPEEAEEAEEPEEAEEVVVELSVVPVENPDGLNVMVGHAHFVKTIEDLHEVLAQAGGQLRFGIAFCEASGPCLVRRSGNDAALVDLAVGNAEAIAAGHSFVVFLAGGFPISVLNAVKAVPEVCTVFCATANPLEVVVGESDLGRGILGVVDGMPPAGVETVADETARKATLRDLGLKL